MTSVGLRWEELLMPLLQKYKLNITWGDQDLLNIIFSHNPGKSTQSGGGWRKKSGQTGETPIVTSYFTPIARKTIL